MACKHTQQSYLGNPSLLFQKLYSEQNKILNKFSFPSRLLKSLTLTNTQKCWKTFIFEIKILGSG